jgi:hypothetical protein
MKLRLVRFPVQSKPPPVVLVLVLVLLIMTTLMLLMRFLLQAPSVICVLLALHSLNLNSNVEMACARLAAVSEASSQKMMKTAKRMRRRLGV